LETSLEYGTDYEMWFLSWEAVFCDKILNPLPRFFLQFFIAFTETKEFSSPPRSFEAQVSILFLSRLLVLALFFS